MTVEHSTLLIAGATVIYVLVSIALWLSTKKQILLTRTIFEATYRPFVGLSTIAIINNPTLQIITWTVTIENAGKAPAASVEITYHRFLDEVCEQTVSHKGRCMILPGKTVCDQLDESRKDVYESIMTGVVILEFALHVKYEDVNKNHHTTNSRSKYNANLCVFDLVESSFT